MANIHSLYPKDIVFCQCNGCNEDIKVGSWFYSINWGRELVLSSAETQPVEVTTSFTFCESCAEKHDFSSIFVKKKWVCSF